MCASKQPLKNRQPNTTLFNTQEKVTNGHLIFFFWVQCLRFQHNAFHLPYETQLMFKKKTLKTQHCIQQQQQ